MTWPQRFPDRPSGSQFGWRTFQGKQTFHYGRDQPAGVGAIHRAHADGKVLVHGHDRVYGFYLVVEYTGAPGVRHHIHQLQDRGRALGAGNFKKGDQLGLVGDPLLSVPVSERFNHATYCGSTFSTGPHSHEEVRTAPQIDAAIDPAGTQASNIWKTIEATQGDDDELDATQNELLRYIAEQVGPGKAGLVTGGPLYAFAQATDKNVRDTRTTQLEDSKTFRDNKLAQKISDTRTTQLEDSAVFRKQGGVANLSTADLSNIATVVANELAKRLGS